MIECTNECSDTDNIQKNGCLSRCKKDPDKFCKNTRTGDSVFCTCHQVFWKTGKYDRVEAQYTNTFGRTHIKRTEPQKKAIKEMRQYQALKQALHAPHYIIGRYSHTSMTKQNIDKAVQAIKDGSEMKKALEIGTKIIEQKNNPCSNKKTAIDYNNCYRHDMEQRGFNNIHDNQSKIIPMVSRNCFRKTKTDNICYPYREQIRHAITNKYIALDCSLDHDTKFDKNENIIEHYEKYHPYESIHWCQQCNVFSNVDHKEVGTKINLGAFVDKCNKEYYFTPTLWSKYKDITTHTNIDDYNEKMITFNDVLRWDSKSHLIHHKTTDDRKSLDRINNNRKSLNSIYNLRKWSLLGSNRRTKHPETSNTLDNMTNSIITNIKSRTQSMVNCFNTVLYAEDPLVAKKALVQASEHYLVYKTDIDDLMTFKQKKSTTDNKQEKTKEPILGQLKSYDDIRTNVESMMEQLREYKQTKQNDIWTIKTNIDAYVDTVFNNLLERVLKEKPPLRKSSAVRNIKVPKNSM